jgi:DNA-binding transcriptional LysR family regulator
MVAGMDIRHLEQIVAICRAGSFSGAAKELGIAQPRLSKSIGRLEAKFGIPLFERKKADRLWLVRRRPCLNAAAENVTTFGHELALATGEAGRLRIGVAPATRLRPLPKLIEKAACVSPAAIRDPLCRA